MKLAIIGFGQMGQFIAKHLKENFEVFVSDFVDRSEIAKNLGVKFISIKDAALIENIVLAVPIDQIPGIINELRDLILPGTTIFDVCSVKEGPLKIISENLPEFVEIIGTHPLFGPQSGANGLLKLKIVLCPVRTTKLSEVTIFLESLGLEVILSTPEEHDFEMAKTQALEHFIGRALINLNISEGSITTPSFKHLLFLKELFKEDSLDLFYSLQKENFFAEKVREAFLEELNKIEKNKK